MEIELLSLVVYGMSRISSTIWSYDILDILSLKSAYRLSFSFISPLYTSDEDKVGFVECNIGYFR